MLESKKTMVLGVSPDPSKRAYKVCQKLLQKGHSIRPVGIREGNVENTPIITHETNPEPVHTVVIYLRAERQKNWIPYIMASTPKRIIFNPGAENEELIDKAKTKGIEILYECTILMLSSNRF
ncbi:MAG: CoA-binding protein [Bacteroidales bacterium]|nr:CoA-binding protein [Bacteroidales bacterium]